MKIKSNGCLKKASLVLIIGLLLLFSLTGCSQSSNSQSIKMDKLDTASAVTTTNGQMDWRYYTQKTIFPSGYSGDFWVVFNFSNILHDKNVNVQTSVYIVSNGILEDESNKYINSSNSTDNTLFWGNKFDISKYTAGNYNIIVTVTDLMTGRSASQMNTLKIGGSG